jgi:calcineurin-like phosphoesterase family protein
VHDSPLVDIIDKTFDVSIDHHGHAGVPFTDIMKTIQQLVACSLLLFLGMTSAQAGNKDAAVQNVWVQVVPPRVGMLRAVTTDRQCPKARFDGKLERMRVRAAPNEDFDVLICELKIPRHTRNIEVAGRTLKPVPRKPQRIAIVGDTGCRMKAGDAIDDGFQNCFDSDDWEFSKVAEQVAAWNPDLIIQLGDYIYREQVCPVGCTNCQGSPYNAPGQRMNTWNADFFQPGRAMLEAAPVVFVRGDHEQCERAGGGYFRFLDAGENRACTDFSDPYALNFRNVQMVVMDTVQADDTKLSTDEVINHYIDDFEKAAKLAKGNTWLMSHRPIWAFRPAADIVGDPVQDVCGNYVEKPALKLEKINLTTQDALKKSRLLGVLPPQVDLVLVSHAHVGEVLSFAGLRAPQMVVGISGTKLLPAVPSADLINQEIDGERVSDALILSDHGFFGFEPTAEHGWKSTIVDVNGSEIAQCTIAHNAAICDAN